MLIQTFQILVLLLFFFFQISQQTAQDIIDLSEKALQQLVNKSAQLYQNKCNLKSCETQIFNECSLFAPPLTCYQEFPTSNSCDVQGGNLSYDHAAGRCSIYVSCDSPEDKELQCSQASLFDDPLIQHEVNSPIKFQYVGFYNSFRMIYPFVHKAYDENDLCTEYDPRYRPWYIAATSGAKNLVLIIDISVSMINSQRIQRARDAAISVVESLAHNDWFEMIFFSDSENWSNQGVKSGSQILDIANQENKDKWIKILNNLGQITDFDDPSIYTEVKGQTNFEIAFDKAFDLFSQTQGQEEGSDCGQNVILFLTDGDITEGKGMNGNDQEILDHIDTLNTIDASIFTYSLGNEVTSQLPKKIACNHSGIWENIEDQNQTTGELRTKMTSYYTYLAKGISESKVIWSDIYKDSSTDLDFITAAMPIYIQENNQEFLLGIAGIDLEVSELKQFQDADIVINEVKNRARSSCLNANTKLSDCDLEALRSEQCFDNLNCGNQSQQQGCSDSYWNYNPFVQDKQYSIDKDASICCEKGQNKNKNDDKEENSKGGMIAAIVIGSLALIFIIFMVYFKVLRKKVEKVDSEIQENNNRPAVNIENNNNNFQNNQQLPLHQDNINIQYQQVRRNSVVNQNNSNRNSNRQSSRVRQQSQNSVQQQSQSSQPQRFNLQQEHSKIIIPNQQQNVQQPNNPFEGKSCQLASQSSKSDIQQGDVYE